MEEAFSPPSSLPPALPMQQISENLRKLHIGERDIRVLFDDTNFSSLLYKLHQVCFVYSNTVKFHQFVEVLTSHLDHLPKGGDGSENPESHLPKGGDPIKKRN
jgi:hypothetical protein